MLQPLRLVNARLLVESESGYTPQDGMKVIKGVILMDGISSMPDFENNLTNKRGFETNGLVQGRYTL
jgi:hypothetical protein